MQLFIPESEFENLRGEQDLYFLTSVCHLIDGTFTPFFTSTNVYFQYSNDKDRKERERKQKRLNGKWILTSGAYDNKTEVGMVIVFSNNIGKIEESPVEWYHVGQVKWKNFNSENNLIQDYNNLMIDYMNSGIRFINSNSIDINGNIYERHR